MFRLANNFKNLAISVDAISTNYTNLQTVRWRRKPRWIGTAKSKIFRVPPPRQFTEDEQAEVLRLYNNYRTQIKSIRRYLTYKHCVRYLASEDPEKQKQIFDEDFQRCLEINNKWNAEQKVVREKHAQDNLESDIEFAKNRIQTQHIKKETIMQDIEAKVREQKELSKTFITPENIDKAIEFALNNPTNYNFAIDLSGEKVTKETEEKEKMSAKQ